MKKIILKKNHGILFWITGLSGSGKTGVSKKIVSSIRKDYGKTIVLSGDEIRNIFSIAINSGFLVDLLKYRNYIRMNLKVIIWRLH